ncbi:peptidoglycan D,D-transpeptidase FtsI family protein [Marinisporobacter balticus]|uniref:beta-lactamase n=1 Tax=Marinisporobacter balticus TaxID=2018667 RepID=A0A4R2KYF1_9FIRM|nr:penicillin-binding transpeptidase domain-containing protein [Marinisporobacter balticus]TCO79084.1 peptidoglycan glycosyltransferase/penicillin-binding protein 2 [Marinisporobacter balticus]
MGYRIDRKKSEQELSISKKNQNRIFVMASIFTFFLFMLIGRLAYIQFVKGNDYAIRAKSQWYKEIPVGIERGKIYDKNMILLTNKKETRCLIIFPETFIASEDNIQIIKDITGIKTIQLKDNKLLSNRPVKLNITNNNEELIKKVTSIKGVFPIDYSDRYDQNPLASHVIGYINKIDNIGEKGIEKMQDPILKENQLYKVGAIVDAQKRMIPGLGYKIIENASPRNKKNVVTTLDYRIQKIAEEEFEKLHKNGSVVILDVKNGEVVAMVSRPDFEPNNVAAYLKSNKKELYNRAVQIGYPPGSIFKIVVAAAALENQMIDMEDHFFCKGYEEIEDIQIKCSSFERGGHGKLNLEEAFALSCNAAFIQLGEKIGGEKIISMAKRFGLGTFTNIGLVEEISGKLPSKDYMKGAGIGNISIGQGTLEVTPLQIAKMTAIIANDGMDKGIYLIKKIVDDQGQLVEKIKRNNAKKVISYANAKKIQLMMEKVVSIGTGKNAKLDAIEGVAGKTGSSQAIEEGEQVVHAWFTGYFPIKEPKYVIAVIVEDGGSGGGVAAPLFKKIAQRINILE